jgi:hypothetical protein
MTEDEQARRRFLEKMEALLGQPLPDDPRALADLEAMLSGPSGERVAWKEVLTNWEEMAPAIAALPPDADDFALVEERFQAAIDRIGDRAFELGPLTGQPPAIRMLIATRAIEGQVDNGGWPAVFYNQVDGLLQIAIDGYGLLALPDHAALASQILEHGFRDGAEDDADWRGFDAAWFALPSAEVARAEFIRAHPDDLPSGR